MTDRDNSPNSNQLLIAAAIYFTVLLILVLFNPALGVGVFLLSSTIMAVAVLIFLARRKGEEVGRSAQVQGYGPRCKARIDEYRRKEDKFRDEANRIRADINALREEMTRATTAPAEDLQRAEETIVALKSAFDLRHTKALFFADCATRLEQLLSRHQLHERLKSSQKELEYLRESAFEDEAAVEQARSQVERDSNQLEALTRISRDAGEGHQTEQTEALRNRMDALRAKILNRATPVKKEKKS